MMKDREMLAAVTAAYDKKKANRPYRRPAPMNQGSSLRELREIEQETTPDNNRQTPVPTKEPKENEYNRVLKETSPDPTTRKSGTPLSLDDLTEREKAELTEYLAKKRASEGNAKKEADARRKAGISGP
jgi:hypothetical protein